MKIYLSCLQSLKDHPIPAYKFWEYYFKKGIEEAGFSWTESEVDWAEGLVYSNDHINLEAWKGRIWEKVLADIKKLHASKQIDVFIAYLYPHQIDLQAIKEIQKLGIPCVNFFCDNVREFSKAPKEYKVFDLNWVPEYKALAMYQRAEYKYLHLPMPMWVAPQSRYLNYSEKYRTTFIGSKDIQRKILFYEIFQKFDDITLRGPGWQKEPTAGQNRSFSFTQKIYNQLDFIYKGGIKAYFFKNVNRIFEPKIADDFFEKYLEPKVFGEDYFEVTKNSLITIGVNRYPSFNYFLLKPDTYSRLRDIEAPMLGACYLTEYTEGLEELYILGEEIETYITPDDMIEKIKMLKTDPLKRAKLRELGQKRALNSHSIPASLKAIKDFLLIS